VRSWATRLNEMSRSGSSFFKVGVRGMNPKPFAADANAGIAQNLLDANRNLSFYWFSLRFSETSVLLSRRVCGVC